MKPDKRRPRDAIRNYALTLPNATINNMNQITAPNSLRDTDKLKRCTKRHESYNENIQSHGIKTYKLKE